MSHLGPHSTHLARYPESFRSLPPSPLAPRQYWLLPEASFPEFLAQTGSRICLVQFLSSNQNRPVELYPPLTSPEIPYRHEVSFILPYLQPLTLDLVLVCDQYLFCGVINAPIVIIQKIGYWNSFQKKGAGEGGRKS